MIKSREGEGSCMPEVSGSRSSAIRSSKSITNRGVRGFLPELRIRSLTDLIEVMLGHRIVDRMLTCLRCDKKCAIEHMIIMMGQTSCE